MTNPFINFAAFQIAWFAGCLGAASGWPVLGPIYSSIWLTLHLAGLGNARQTELRLILVAALIGYVADSSLVLSGLITFPEQAVLGRPSTLWMVVLWMNLAATLRHCLGWLRARHIVMSALLGGIAGPAAYFAGAKLGAVILPQSSFSIAAIALEWTIATPLLILLVKRFEIHVAAPQRLHAQGKSQ